MFCHKLSKAQPNIGLLILILPCISCSVQVSFLYVVDYHFGHAGTSTLSYLYLSVNIYYFSLRMAIYSASLAQIKM